MTPIDIVVPSHAKDIPTLARTVQAALKHLRPAGQLYVVSREPFASSDGRVHWVPEPDGKSFPSVEDVRERLASRGAGTARSTWIYQQLLKLGASEYIDGLSPSYLVLDSDVIFLRPVSFQTDSGIRFLYAPAKEEHEPYRASYVRLLGSPPTTTTTSLVAHHMLYDRELLSELTSEIARRAARAWHEAYVDATDPAEPSSISEFNTYGWWVLERHPALALARPLAWQNLRSVPLALEQRLLARRYDFVAAHEHSRSTGARAIVEPPARVVRHLRRLAGAGRE